MSDTLTARLSELRAAAQQLRQSAQTVRTAFESACHGAAELAALGLPPLPAQSRLSGPEPRATLERLDTLRDQLARAVDALDEADRPFRAPLGVLWNRLGRRERLRASPDAPVGPPAYTLGRYLSRYNRPLYDALLADQALMVREGERLAELRAEHERVHADYAALQNRLLTAGIAPAGHPQSREFERQLAYLEREQAQSQQRITEAQQRIDEARARLLRVTPPDEADVALLRTLEGAQSEPYVLANTRDCVNYIATRVAIPGELAANAHLWDERAAELTRFGIRAGDTPLPGAVLVMEQDHPYASDLYGHVMLVEWVDSAGIPWVTDNQHSAPVRLTDLTPEISGDRVKYLYLPWYTCAG